MNAAVSLPNHVHTQRAAAIQIDFSGKTKPEKKELITKIIEQRVLGGVINDRKGVINTLCEFGIITRQGKDTVSVKLDGDKQAIRLSGSFIKMSSMSLLTQTIEQEQKLISEHQAQMKLMKIELKNCLDNFNLQLEQELNTTQKGIISRLKLLDHQTQQGYQQLLNSLHVQTESAQMLTQKSAEMLSKVQELSQQAQSLNIQEQVKNQKQQMILVLSASCTVLLLIIILILLVK